MADKENVLSPEELDALAAGVKDGSIESNTGLNTQLKPVKHDLVNEESAGGMNTSAINPINERFLILLKQRLSGIIKTPVNGAAEEVSIQTYGEFIGRLKAPQAINVIRARPLHGEALVIIDPNLIAECFNSFFGSSTASEASGSGDKEFTRTELSINKILMAEIYNSLQEAWAPIQPLTCTGVDFTSDPKKVKTMKFGRLFEFTDRNKNAEFHWRIGIPISTLILALLAIPMSRSEPRQGQYNKIFIGVVTFIIYFNLLSAGKSWLENGLVDHRFGLWWVHVLMLFALSVLIIKNNNPHWYRLNRAEDSN